MPEGQWFYVLVCLAGVFLSSVSQVMLKKAAQKNHKSVLAEYLNPLVIVAYLIFFGTTVISVWAYKGLPLSLGPVLETTGYIYITLFGVLLFKEKLNAKRLLALGLIIAGVLVCAL
ncbi:MAG: multidrug ABC transporter [Ruminococcaceae bacterium]|nr:multidrug ABC transporter [Oscillospiraceae bacterium]